jgi:hypothetical protein
LLVVVDDCDGRRRLASLERKKKEVMNGEQVNAPSGAIQKIDPCMLMFSLFWYMSPLFLLVPKSEILQNPSWSMRMLSAFMSRWRIPREWRYSRPSRIWCVKYLMTFSSNYERMKRVCEGRKRGRREEDELCHECG